MGNNAKAGVSSAQKRQTKKKNKKHRKFWLGVKIFLLVVLLAVLTALGIFYFKYGDELLGWRNEAVKIVKNSSVDTFRSSETSIIYASNKSMMAKLKGDKDSYYLEANNIPQSVKDAFIITEDRDFFKHEGVNYLSTMKAAFLLVKSKINNEKPSRGGSTITQQLARGVFLSNEQTYERKFREMFIATEMEKKYSKSQILEFYINNIYFANGYYGIEAAAKGYFSKSASELDLAETAFLCAIPNSPNRYNPLEHFDDTNERKERILAQMLEGEMITAAEYSDACYKDIIMKPAESIKNQNYTTTFAMNCAAKALMDAKGFEIKTSFKSDAEREEYEKEYDEMFDECYKSLYTGGYRIYTSLNKKKQNKLQKVVNQQLDGFKDKTDGIYKLQGAATCIDNETGFVVAIVGGRKQKILTGYTLNRAYQSYRQPGSCFKPVAVYTPQLERGYTPDSIVDDSYFEGGPKNSSGTYSGKVPLRYAVEHSKNVVAWKLFDELTPQVGLQYVKDMNFANIVDTDNTLAASLGGLTNGVTTVEMASAYAALANDGVYRTPTCIKKITDSEGKVIINYSKNSRKKQIYKKDAAHMMTDILRGVLIRGTAAGSGLDNMDCAGKTGTTSDQRDGWFCGYTPYYTTTVWVGYDQPKTMSDLYGNTYPLRIWRDFMMQIHDGLDNKEFDISLSDDDSDKKPWSGDDDSYEGDSGDDDIGGGDIEQDDKIDDTTQKPQKTQKPKATKEPDIDTEPDDTVTEPDVGDDNQDDDVPNDIPDIGDDIPDVGEDDVPDDVGPNDVE